ncbi:hypothetical protein [Salinicoccus roseus]|nr:hypothetical protein [Salinicoccus roseus]MDB0581362.1 replication terminator protein [Salinicoccus roseus]
MKLQNLNLSEIASGALQEHFEREAERVVENLMDINTDPKKKRKITLTLDLTIDDNREIIFADASAKSTLVPVDGTGFNMMSGVDENGERIVSELKSGIKGQSYFDENGEVRNDDGSKPKHNLKNNVESLYK